jgi:secreted effector protein SseB
MATSINTNGSQQSSVVNSLGSVSSGKSNKFDDPNLRGVFEGIALFYKIMELQNYIATTKYQQLLEASERARQSQGISNKVAASIADILKPDDRKELSKEALDYLREKGIQITGDNNNGLKQNIDDYLYSILSAADKTYVDNQINLAKTDPVNNPKAAENAEWYLRKALTKGQLMTIKSALDTDANANSDTVSQNQLQIQKVMQNFNVSMSMISSMQSMLKDTSLSIIQKI